MEVSNLTNHVTKFLLNSSEPNTVLYRFCFSIHKNGKYDCFLEELDKKIQREMRVKSYIKNENEGNSKVKLKFLRKESAIKSNLIFQRYKTEDCEKISLKKN